MTNKPCEEIRDLLVDYADGELSGQDSQAVTEHLAECPACQEIVQSLRQSLHLARAIWQDNLEGEESVPSAAVRQRAVRRLCYGAAAAGIVIAASVLLLNAVRRPAEPDAAYGSIEQQVARAATAARLLAATQIIAKCEGTQSIVERQRRYILSNYADTSVAAALRAGDDLSIGEIDHD